MCDPKIHLIEIISCILSDANIGEGRAILITWAATLIAAMVAFYFYGIRENRNFRNSNSAEFFKKENEKLDKAISKISKKIYRQSEHCQRMTPIESKNFQPEMEIIVAHFEIVAIGIYGGYLSEKYIINAERFRLTNCFICLSPNIQNARDILKHKSSAENFEKLFLRTYFPFYKIFTYPFEIFLPWPLFSVSRILFRIEYYLNHKIWTFIIGSDYIVDALPLYYMDAEWLATRKVFYRTRVLALVFIALLTPIAIYHYQTYM